MDTFSNIFTLVYKQALIFHVLFPPQAFTTTKYYAYCDSNQSNKPAAAEVFGFRGNSVMLYMFQTVAFIDLRHLLECRDTVL